MSDVIKPMQPNMTQVRLLNVPIESDYKDTIFFESEVDQYTYFYNKTMLTGNNFTFQRKDNVIRWGEHIDLISVCNYVMYRNAGYSDKWFYAFIKKMEYVSDGRTDIYIETDVMQTYMFDYVVQPSFVEREHVNDDSVGLHTYPEGLETGEYIVNYHYVDETLKDLILVIGITATPDGGKVGGHNYNGIYSGVQYRCCKATKPSIMTEFINSYDNEGRSSAIQCIFMAPEFLASYTDIASDSMTVIPNNNYFRSYIIKRNKNKKLNGYTPKNNKLLCYPYNFLTVSNNNGASAVYKYENFTGDDYTFNVKGAITPGTSIRALPTSYKNDNEYDDEGLNLGKYPICNWQTDVYTNWLTQNSVNNAVAIGGSIANTAINTVGSLMTGNIMGTVSNVVGGATAIGGTLGQIYAQSFQAPQVNGNTNCGDVVTSDNKNSFHFYDMSIKKEYAYIIDEYFDMYGYKVCRVKTPNKNHRMSWWYTKTINVNIDGGSIPQDDLNKIKSCYNNGITFWKTANVGNYSLSNNIV